MFSLDIYMTVIILEVLYSIFTVLRVSNENVELYIPGGDTIEQDYRSLVKMYVCYSILI